MDSKDSAKIAAGLDRILADNLAKRIYIALIPVKRAAEELAQDVKDGDLAADDWRVAETNEIEAAMLRVIERCLKEKDAA